MSRLCLTLCRSTLDANLEDLRQNSPDLAELRIDYLNAEELHKIVNFPQLAQIPLILTCRKVVDGGLWSGSDKEREALLYSSMEGAFDFIDLEEDEFSESLMSRARKKGIQIIRSLHDFKMLPADLAQRLDKMSYKGDLVKAAVMPRGIADVLTLFQIGKQWSETHPGRDNLILLGMGDYGVASRILAQRMGSYLTFCSPSGAEAAPGHMDWDTLHNLYRVNAIDSETAIYGIIGNPVLHTLSPQIHNPGFQRAGLNAVYLPFTVDDISSFFKLAEYLDIRGFSVTVPYKLGVREFLHQEDPGVTAIASCNTVVRKKEDWVGYNTDAPGFIHPLIEVAGKLEGQKAAVIGAGGAARAVVYALLKEGCDVNIFNRTEARARSLAEEMGCRGFSLEVLKTQMDEGKSYDLVIQTSSVGMEGNHGPSNPVPFYKFTGKELVNDIIYTPPVTEFLKIAEKAGARCLNGMPMLQEQGRAQFKLFTGNEFPLK